MTHGSYFKFRVLLNSNIWHRHAEVKLTKSKFVLQTAIVSVRLGNSQMCLSVSQHCFFERQITLLRLKVVFLEQWVLMGTLCAGKL